MKGFTFALASVAGLLGLTVAGFSVLVNSLSGLFTDCDPHCNAWQSKPVPNGLGEVAIVRREYSGGLPDDYRPVSNAVYVHGMTKNNSNATLALRYYALEEDGSLPVIRWTGRTSLTVVVATKSIVQMTRERSIVGGITLTYRLPRAVCRATNLPLERPRIAETCDYSKELDRFVDSLLKGD